MMKKELPGRGIVIKACFKMNASASPLQFWQLWARALLGWLVIAVLFPACLSAQDTLVLTNGQRLEGQVLEVADGRVCFKTGPAETRVPIDQVKSASMQPPRAFQDVLEFSRKGDPAKALAALQPLVQKFRGLPAPWAERASAMLGSLLLETGKVPEAEAAFTKFQSAYPKAQGLANLGLARLAIEKKDFNVAEPKLRPLVDQARKTLLAPSGKNAEYGQALYLMGIILEEQGQAPEALEHYLLAATVFSEDAGVAARAQERADALSEKKKVAVP